MVNAQVPRVVILWVIDYKNELYVLGNSSSGWVQMIGQGAPVKLRLANSTFNLTAERVTEGLDPIKTAYIEKYRRDYPDIVENLPQEKNFRVFHLKRPLI